LVQNKHDIRNHRKKLYGIAYVLTRSFFHQNSPGIVLNHLFMKPPCGLL
jgi:hypothetical protein